MLISLSRLFNALESAISCMAVSAVVESERLKKSTMMMSVFWLVPQLAIVGMGEAFHYAGQVTLYYQEFPESLKNTSNAAVAMFISGAFYSSYLVIDLVRKATGWLDYDGMRITFTGFVVVWEELNGLLCCGYSVLQVQRMLNLHMFYLA